MANSLLKNPWVWAAGAGVAVIAFATKGGGGSSPAGTSASFGGVPASAVELNKVATTAIVERERIKANQSIEVAKLNTGYQAAFLANMTNLANVRSMEKRQLAEVASGIQKTRIVTEATATRDRFAGVFASIRATAAGDAQARVVNAQGMAAAKLAKAQKPSTGELIAGTVNNIANTATAALKAFAF